MEADMDISDQDVNEEKSDGSERGAEDSESHSSLGEGDDDSSQSKDGKKDMRTSEDVKDDESDSKSSTSSHKQEELSEEELQDDDSDDTTQLPSVHHVDVPDGREHVNIDSSSEGMAHVQECADSKQDSGLSARTNKEQIQSNEYKDKAIDELSFLCQMPPENDQAEKPHEGGVTESIPIQESSDSLPNLQVLSVSETKSEFARHPDSTPKQQLNQRVDDQEAELDFEEEVSEDRREEADCGEEGEKSQDEDDKDRFKEDGENMDDGDDDGEVEDDDDLEEGEVKDPVASTRKPQQRPVCRFFNKGQCTWGSSCRFIHPGINDKGNYNMFGPTKPLVPNNGPALGGLIGMPLGPLRGHPAYGGRIPAEVVVPPPPVDDAPPVESAWERGLRHAKENLKKANKRKEMEPDFEEKRFNLTIGAGDPEFEKENDYYSRSPFRKNTDPYQAYGYDDPPDPIDRQAQEFWRGGNYENFEVRYLRTEYDNYREKDKENKERSRREKYEHPRNHDRGGGGGGGGGSWRESRYAEVQGTSRNRADEWKDPWRRSTSPKRRGRSKSYSSASSGTSYSSGSSRSRSSSFSSHSRSSSGTSYSSRSRYKGKLGKEENLCGSRSYSRSRSRNRPSPHRHRNAAPSSSNAPRKKQLPTPVQKSQALPAKTSRPPPDKHLPTPHCAPTAPSSLPPEQKKKRPPVPTVEPAPVEKRPPPTSRTKRPRSPSLSGSESGSSRSRSSRSSLSRSSSHSSVSSRSSSRSSSISSVSDGERRTNGVKKKERFIEHEQDQKLMAHLDPQAKAGSTTRGSKDPLKQSGQKPQIKLTLLNKVKPVPEKAGNAPLAHKDVMPAKSRPQISDKEPKVIPKLPPPAVILGLSKPAKPTSSPPSKSQLKSGSPVKSSGTLLGMEPPKVPKPAISSSGSSRKRTAPSPSPPQGLVAPAPGSKSSPTTTSQQLPPPPPPPPPQAPSAKKSTLSRREELLKQLKAVEDAIARKRAKLT